MHEYSKALLTAKVEELDREIMFAKEEHGYAIANVRHVSERIGKLQRYRDILTADIEDQLTGTAHELTESQADYQPGLPSSADLDTIAAEQALAEHSTSRFDHN